MNTTGLTALNVSMNTSKGKDAIVPSAAEPDAGEAMTLEPAITAEGTAWPEPDAAIWALRCYAATLDLHFGAGYAMRNAPNYLSGKQALIQPLANNRTFRVRFLLRYAWLDGKVSP